MSAVVVSYNTRESLLRAIASLPGSDGVQTIVVDNASVDGSADAVEQGFPNVSLVRSDDNLGFAAGVNAGVERARGEFLLLLNPDAALDRGALAWLTSFLDRHPRAAAVGPTLVFPDGRLQESAFRFPGLAQVFLDLFPVPRLMGSRLNGRYSPATRARKVDVLLGACMLIRRSAWEDVGPLDQGYFIYVEEVDWCRRARRNGWEIWLQPSARATHVGGESTRQQADAMFLQLWRSRLHYYGLHHGRWYNRLVHGLVRLGMRAEARRALRQLDGAPLEARLHTLRAIYSLAS